MNFCKSRGVSDALSRRTDFILRCRVVAGTAAVVFCSLALADQSALMGVEQVVAHRGSSLDRPENTLASFRRAIEAGATTVEVDVRTTRDGHLVVLHDATLDRTTTGSGRVRDLTLDEVRQFDAGRWFDPKYAGERVPTLKEILILCDGQVEVLLDLKEKGEEYARAVAAEITAHGSPDQTIVGVRSVEQARQFRRLLPKSRQLGFIPKPEAIEAFAEAGVQTIRLWPRWIERDPTLAERVRKAGARLHLNGKTGKPDETLRLLKFQPVSLITDDPAQLLRTLTELSANQGTESETPER